MRRHPVIKPNTTALTAREEQILAAIAVGVGRRLEIAAYLSISTNGVGIHLTRLLSKGAIQRVGCGEYAVAKTGKKAAPKSPSVSPSGSFIAPIPLSRLMGGRA